MKRLIAKDGLKHRCTICQVDIEVDLIVCPSCLRAFHYNHLINWLISENSQSKCPACKVVLEMIDS